MAAALTLGATDGALAQSVLSKAERTSESMEPALVHPDQAAAAQAKLDALFAETGKRPNIVWLVVDDMGYGDPGAFGGGAAVGAATPNMDRLAREGLKLTSTYSQPTCTPTRSAILTGRLPVRTGLTRPILAGDKITKNPWADEMSLPKLLGEAGYTTVLSGKWHVGEAEGMRPHDIGFDEFYGYYEAREGDQPGRRQAPLSRSRAESRAAGDAAQDRVEQRAGPRLQGRRDHGRRDDRQHRGDGRGRPDAEGIHGREDQGAAAGGKPFFLEHAFMKVHADNFASKAFEGKSASKYPYKDDVVEVDAYIGEIVDGARRGGRARQHLHLRHLRQWPAAR